MQTFEMTGTRSQASRRGRFGDRIAFRAVTLASGGFAVGAALGALVGGPAFPELTGGLIGSAAGITGAVILSSYAWLFDGPVRGAIRCASLLGSGMATATLISFVAASPDEPGFAHALQVAFLAGAIGAGVGVLLGAGLGWLIGPIVVGIVEEIDSQQPASS